MKNDNEILKELQNMGSSLADLSRAMPYSVPSGYFESLPDGIADVVHIANEPVTAPNWGKNLPYSVPAGYFEAFPHIATALAKNYHLTGNTMKVPDGYFEALPGKILSAVKDEGGRTRKSRTVPMPRPAVIRSLKWAVAAVLLITIGLGAYEFFIDQPGPSERILATVPESEIHDYLQNTATFRMDVDRVVDDNDVAKLQLDNRDIIQYLNETGWD